MKNLLIIISFLCFSVTLHSQKININQDENKQKNKLLLKRIKSKDSINTIEINQYLAKNKQSKKVFKNEAGKTFVLYKILEGKPIYRTTDNINAAYATNTNELQIGGSLNLNLDGTGMTVWVWDGGPIQQTHVEFQNSDNTASRVLNIENVTTEGVNGVDDHANHVSGTIAAKGVNTNAKGMAPNVTIHTYNFNNDNVEMVSVLNNPSSEMILSNHSYGISIVQDGSTLDSWIMGAYTDDARQIDEIARTNPNYLIVSSAGNGGQTNYSGGLYTGYDKLTGDKNSKNNLVVANAAPELNPFTNEISSLVINTGSSQGPTDDLRIKPDIAGDGTGLFSPTTNDTYSTFSGTSMSAPNVTGSLVLLQQYYNQLYGNYMKASTLKGLVCHTAKDDDTNSGPDPNFGWGILDAEMAANTITDNENGSAKIQELQLNNGETYSFDFNVVSGGNLSATICWTDVPGVAVSGNSNLNNQTPRLINDLDIRITSNSSTYFPWKLDYSTSTGFSNSKGDNIVDNIEKINIESAPIGNYTLTISHKGNLTASEPFGPQNQDFSLILTGSDLTLGVKENAIDNLAIWPNPTSDILNYRFNSLNSNDVNVSLLDIQGRAVYSSVLDGSNSIINGSFNTDDYAQGIYILNIKQGTSQINKRVIIK